MTHVAVGTLLAGKYRIESLLGRGGMGTVWRAEHLGLRAPIAVKLLDLAQFAGSTEALNRFNREAHAAASIRSPHVVQIFDFGVDEATETPFIAMELLEGESLAQRLSRAGRIAPVEAARVFTHVARALSRAHEAHIVHRDLKPDNVFLVRNEDDEIAKVLDFGIAKAQAHGINGDSGTRTGAVMGTAYYMSPEQISGAKAVDFRTDLWAFGVMACECLTGVRPFGADTIGGLTLQICVEPIPRPSSFAAVPDGFDDWFARSVQRDPAQRFASAREAADALRALCTAGPRATLVSQAAPSATVADVPVPRLGTAAPLSRSTSDSPPAPRTWLARALPVGIGALVVFALVGGVLVRYLRQVDDAGEPVPSATAPVPTTAAATAESAPSAVPATCTANATQCAGAAPQTCADGQWVSGPVTAGQCSAECSPASAMPRCAGSTPQTCDLKGKWQSGRACNHGESCQSGVCGRPKPATIVTPQPVVAQRKPDCDPSYTLDAQGQKHFKPECFK